MLKQVCLITVVILLTLWLTSCKTTEEALKGEVVPITEVCTTEEAHKDLYNSYKKSYEEGNKLYHKFLFEKKCFNFGTDVLVKKLAIVFKERINKDFNIEIWKVIFNEERDENNELKYFYVAKAIENSKIEELKVNYNGR
jgi:hypothetical protein|tara:strand:+ start:920 stop:1339 length:420 start_codon:yes stop_codon:yes gene_type:complete